MTPTLDTPRLTLRPIALTDAPAIQKYIDDPAVIGQLSTAVPWPYPPDGAQRFLEDILLPSVAKGDTYAWVLVPKAGPDEAIGVIEYRSKPGVAGDRGFWLAQKWWRQGLMTEAVAAVQDWLFFELGIEALRLANAIDNVASSRIKARSGAVRTGEIELAMHHTSRVETWRLTREAWAEARKPS